ncbi:MAG TPA: type II toxin-antitoxin system HicB family antitoxin [Dehalococcoidia bacterium]|nr:type II toxin-antitoxin system HicB family antitoxin [Dehalococcoidia bacterium]
MAQSRKASRFHIRFEKAEEGGFVVSVPELPGCVSEGATFEEALAMIKDAMAGWLAVACKHADPIPEPFPEVLAELDRLPTI